MARPPRIVIPGMPLHVVQRGHNRCDIFHDDRDRQFFLGCLQEGCRDYACEIHAYVLMTNHVHLLLSPCSEDGPPRLMQFVGGRCAAYFNGRYERVGSPWQGRYKASIVDSEPYFLVCARYVELNPVRARMVDHPAGYRWSSYAHNAMGRPDPLVRTHPLLEALGGSAGDRCAAYAALFDEALDGRTVGAIRESTNSGRALGDRRFRDYVQSIAGKGRPPADK